MTHVQARYILKNQKSERHVNFGMGNVIFVEMEIMPMPNGQ